MSRPFHSQRVVGRMVTVMLVVLFAAARGEAQSVDTQSPGAGADGAFQGVFAPSADSASAQTLTMTADLLGAWDSNVTTAALGLRPDERVQIPGIYSTFRGALQYRHSFPRSNFQVSAGGLGRYLPGEAMTPSSGWTSVTFQRSMTDRTGVSLSARGAYAPYFQLNLLPGSPAVDLAGSPMGDPGLSMDEAVLWRPELSYGGAANLTHQINPRLSFQLESSFDRRTATDQNGLDYRAGGRLHYQFTSTTGFHVGYIRQQLTNQIFAQRPVVVDHQMDVGIDYRRAPSPDHRLTFGFSTASTVVRTGQDGLSGRLRFSMLGSAFLARAIGRTWSARIDYDRRLQFLEISPQPFFVNMAQAGIAGYLGRRVQVQWMSGYSTSVLTSGGYGFSAWSTSVRDQVALSQSLALSAEYVFYVYRFGGGVDLPVDLNRQLNRQGVRFGLAWWIPFIR